MGVLGRGVTGDTVSLGLIRTEHPTIGTFWNALAPLARARLLVQKSSAAAQSGELRAELSGKDPSTSYPNAPAVPPGNGRELSRG